MGSNAHLIHGVETRLHTLTPRGRHHLGMYTCSAETVKDLFYHNGPNNYGQLEIAGIEVTCLVYIYILLIALSPLCVSVSVSVCHFAYSSKTKGDRYVGFVAQERDYLREC